MREITLELKVYSERLEEVHGGWNSTICRRTWRHKRRICGQMRRLRVDSPQEEVEEIKARWLEVAALLGVAGIDGSTMNSGGGSGVFFSISFLLQRKKRVGERDVRKEAG
jgi:hypothetical protein